MTGLNFHLLQRLEPVLFTRTGQRWSLLFLITASLLLIGQAAQLRFDASFEKNIPLDHPHMQVLRQYHEDFGGANSVLVALIQDSGDIYNATFLRALNTATTEVTFIPGIDRTRVASLFTRNISFIEADEEGFAGDNVIPPDYRPSPAMFERIRLNVGKAGLVGRLVSLDQRGAMVSTEVLARDPVTGQATNLVSISEQLERQVRQRLTRPHRYRLIASRALPGFAAGDTVRVQFESPGLLHRLRNYTARSLNAQGQMQDRSIRGADLEVRREPNPDYVPGLSVHIIGFSSIVGAVAAATTEVMGFFLLSIVLSMLVLRGYLGNTRLALLPMACALLAVIWEFGLLRALGFGLDPFAILVPFLVLAVSISHGVQYVNRWSDELVDGAEPHQASRRTFRHLFVPGAIALLTNIAGFMTIYLVPIDAVREMAINASLGMLAVFISNKWLMPICLCHLRISNPDIFEHHRQTTRRLGDRLWNRIARVSRRGPALGLTALSLLVLGASLWLQQDRIIGDALPGVPELRPDARYNQDVTAILDNFALGTDVLKVIAETPENACIDYEALEQVDRFAWRMRNVTGVTEVISATGVAKQIFAAMNENNPHFLVLPRNRYALVLATTPIESSSGLLNYNCSAMPLIIFASDHKAATITRIVDAAQRYNAQNAQAFFHAHGADAERQAYCQARTRLRRQIGTEQLSHRQMIDELLHQGISEQDARASPKARQQLRQLETLQGELQAMDKACPVNFALGTGNIGVMAATNEVVAAKEWPALAGVYAVIFILLMLSYRSVKAWLIIGLPLAMVSVFANALMAQLGIGLKVATLPVVTLAVGIGVDYGIYIYDVLQHKLARAAGTLSLQQAYLETLRETGKAVIFTGIVLAGSVSTWLASELQFQRDMGVLLVFMFSANMLGAVLLGPAFFRLLHPRIPA